MARGDLRVVRRIQALLALADGQSVQEVAAMLSLGQQTVRDYRNRLSPERRLQVLSTSARRVDPAN